MLFLVAVIDFVLSVYPGDLTVSKRPGTSFRIEIHFTVFNRVYLLFSFIKLVKNLVIMFITENYKSTRSLETK